MTKEPTELYRKYRPQKFSEVIGQDGVVKTLNDLGKRKALPHFILMTGESGCGKTTIARILAKRLKCSDRDFHELNMADFRGIDMVREIRGRVQLMPLGGKVRVWLIDEAHKMTGDAQNAFLKMLEDTPFTDYFIFATTEPEKLLKTVRNRATEFKVRPLNREDMENLLHKVFESECGAGLSEELRDKIIDHADGSPRKALVLLNQVIGLEDEEDQLAAVEAGDAKAQAIAIARALFDPRTSWLDMAKILKGVDDEPEGLRYMVLGYASSVLLGGGKNSKRAFEVIDVFRENFYNSKRAGLIAACYEVIVGD